jgi:hypothetical protein
MPDFLNFKLTHVPPAAQVSRDRQHQRALAQSPEMQRATFAARHAVSGMAGSDD